MRKVRKALSFVLILALVMGSFSMVFGADSSQLTGDVPVLSDVSGLTGEEQIYVCQLLGIITGNPDGTYTPAKDVNRAEFAAIISRAMGIPESALVGYSSTSFKDTAGYSWAVPYLAFCQTRGIMIGDGQGNAMPGRTITVNEAITMIARAVGYIDTSAELVGRWPANYITVGQTAGLFEDLDNTKVYMTKEMAAIAIYNALTVQRVAVATDGKTDPIWNVRPVEGVEDSGVISCLLNSGLECNLEDEQVLGESWNYSNSLINISDRIGTFGTAFITKNNELIAFKAARNTMLLTGEIDGSNFVTDDGKSYAFANNVTYGAIINGFGMYRGEPTGTVKIWNGNASNVRAGEFHIGKDVFKSTVGDAVGAFGENKLADLVNGYAEKFDGDRITLAVKLSGTTIRNVYSLVGWKATKASVITASELNSITNSKTLLGTDFALDYDQAIATKQFSLIGAADLAGIEADDVVYIYGDDASSEKIRRVAVGKEVIEGMVDEVNVNSGDETGDYIEVGGTRYDYAYDHLKIFGTATDITNPTEVSDSAGSDAVMKLDAYGNAYNIDATGDVGLFGIVLNSEAAGEIDGARIKVFDKDENEPAYYSTSKAKEYYNRYHRDLLIGETGIDVANKVKNNSLLIGYKLNASNNITDVVYPGTGLNVGNTASKNLKGDVDIKSRTVLSVNGASYAIDANAVVLTYDGAAVKFNNYTVADIRNRNFASSTVANLDPSAAEDNNFGEVILNSSGNRVIAMLLHDGVGNATSATYYGVMNGVSNRSNTNGDKYLRLDVLLKGSTVTTLDTIIDPDPVDNLNNDQPMVYKFTLNGDGRVKNIDRLGDVITSDGVNKARQLAAKVDVSTSGGINTSSNYFKDTAGNIYPFASDAVVYKVKQTTLNTTKATYEVSALGNITDKAYVWLYTDVDKDDLATSDEATIIVWYDNRL